MTKIDMQTGEIVDHDAYVPNFTLNPVKVPFLRSAYNYDRDQASVESGLVCDEPTKAQQQFAEESDINVIVRRFGLTGQLPQNVRMPTYGDFTGISDFHTAANALRAAEEAFAAMPADVRARFGNDPGAFVDFTSDESNRAEAEKLGLIDPAITLERARQAQKLADATGQGVPPAPSPAAPPAPVVPTGVVPKG